MSTLRRSAEDRSAPGDGTEPLKKELLDESADLVCRGGAGRDLVPVKKWTRQMSRPLQFRTVASGVAPSRPTDKNRTSQGCEEI